MSKLKTTTSNTRHLTNPQTGELFFETDTSRLVFWDGGKWHVYRRDSINYPTGGAEELHYATGLFSDTQNVNYITQSPVMHFDSSRVGSIELEYYGEDKVIVQSSGPFGWVNIASPGVKDIYFSGYTGGTKIIDKGSGVQGVIFNTGDGSLTNGTDQSQYTTENETTSFNRGPLEPVTLVWLTKRIGSDLHPTSWSSTMFGAFVFNDWQATAPLGGGTISLINIVPNQAAWDDVHAKFGSDYILQIVRHDGETGPVEWYVNGDTYSFDRGNNSTLQSLKSSPGTENYEMLAFEHAIDSNQINRIISYLNNKYNATLPNWNS